MTIVNPASAHPAVGADPVGLDEDHLSIAKPRERDAQVCGAALALLREYVLFSLAHPPLRAPTSSAGAAAATTVNIDCVNLRTPGPVPTPHELPPSAEESSAVSRITTPYPASARP